MAIIRNPNGQGYIDDGVGGFQTSGLFSGSGLSGMSQPPGYIGAPHPNGPPNPNTPHSGGAPAPNAPPVGSTPPQGGSMNTSSMIDQLIQAINNPQNNGSPQMTAMPGTNNAAGLQPFLNSPMYQLLYGSNAARMTQATGMYNPTAAFQADPGFEFNQDQTAKALQQRGAAKGLLESGPMQVELQRQLQGNQNQMYQTWLGQQNNLYGSYQSQLAGLANMGLNSTGADQANASGGQLAALLAQINMGTGQNLGQAQLSTGENISGLYANQGSLNASAYLNTGAAMANALQNTAGMNAQMANNAAASYAQQQSSFNRGLGALLGANSVTGGGNNSSGVAANGAYSTAGNPWGYQF